MNEREELYRTAITAIAQAYEERKEAREWYAECLVDGELGRYTEAARKDKRLANARLWAIVHLVSGMFGVNVWDLMDEAKSIAERA